jgi:hypothetical protein
MEILEGGESRRRNSFLTRRASGSNILAESTLKVGCTIIFRIMGFILRAETSCSIGRYLGDRLSSSSSLETCLTVLIHLN